MRLASAQSDLQGTGSEDSEPRQFCSNNGPTENLLRCRALDALRYEIEILEPVPKLDAHRRRVAAAST